MRLTNDMRQAVAIGLVVHAARKNVKPMNNAEAALKKLWHDTLRKEALTFYPELSQERVRELLNARCLVHYRADPQYSPVTVTGSQRSGGVDDDYNAKHTRPVLDALKQKFNFSLYSCRVYYGRIELSSRSPDECPRIPEQREGFLPEVENYNQEMRYLAMKHVVIYEQSMNLYYELRGIVDSISTVEKLCELLPEANAHLPALKPTSNGIVPLETIQRARAIMETGIPD